MAVILPTNLPVAETLNSPRDIASGIKLKIGILNIMPLKERTEADFLRILDRMPLDIEVDFIYMESHTSKNSSQQRITEFYIPSSTAMQRSYDALIVTGAPVELVPFEEVDYWDEVCKIIDWSANSVPTVMFVCWGAFAALYHRYGVDKILLPEKVSGVFVQEILEPDSPAVCNFPPRFHVPHSRNTEIDSGAIKKFPDLHILAGSEDVGPHLIFDTRNNDFYVLGHWEYAPDTLDMEYRRDLAKGINPQIPLDYYYNDNPDNGYYSLWVEHGIRFFKNWIMNYVVPKKR